MLSSSLTNAYDWSLPIPHFDGAQKQILLDSDLTDIYLIENLQSWMYLTSDTLGDLLILLKVFVVQFQFRISGFVFGEISI